ncbi:hypothetical protein R2301_003983 [Cronobacter dublinensis]|nr:hypothetical protein [Cronobacter dublinensis]
MSEMSKEQDGNLRELCDDLKRWQGYYDPVDDKGQHEMFVSAADAVTELLALRKEREAAVPVAYADPQAFRNFQAGTATKEWVWAKPDAGLVPVFVEAPPAPPAPVVPDDMPKGLAGQIVSLLAHNIGDKLLAQKIWNACRAAMLAAPGKN